MNTQACWRRSSRGCGHWLIPQAGSGQSESSHPLPCPWNGSFFHSSDSQNFFRHVVMWEWWVVENCLDYVNTWLNLIKASKLLRFWWVQRPSYIVANTSLEYEFPCLFIISLNQSGVICFFLLSLLFLSVWRPALNFTWKTPEVANQWGSLCVFAFLLHAELVLWSSEGAHSVGIMISTSWCPEAIFFALLARAFFYVVKVLTAFLCTWCYSKKTWRFLLLVVGRYALAHKFLRPNKLSSHLLLFFSFLKWTSQISWSRKCQPTPESLLRNCYGQSSQMGYSPWVTKSWTWLRACVCTHRRTYTHTAVVSFLLHFF